MLVLGVESVAGDPGELDWHGEHVNLVDTPALSDLVEELHAKVLAYIRLYPVDH
eukprot:COSAG02_NODE_18556_length_932_cov_1.552221_2_plen_54_part_00